jgi:DNA-binding MarR family transcriptional regulator
VLGEQNELKNRYLHINFQSVKPINSKGQIDTLNLTLEERAVLNCVLPDAKITQQEIADQIRKTPRTVKRILASLSEKQIIVRKNGKRDGWWEVLVDLPTL